MKEVRCADCGWTGTLTEAWDATKSVMYEESEDLYDEDNAHFCPICHKETLEVFEDGNRLGSMYIYG